MTLVLKGGEVVDETGRRRADVLIDDDGAIAAVGDGLDGDRTLVMHPGPMNRGVEIAAEVADLPRSVVIDQVRNGVAVRMAVLYLLVGSGVDLRGAIT